MCGFVGICSFREDTTVWSQQLKIANGLIAHRGPDDEAYFLSQPMSVGFRRLKIIDLSDGGRQPFSDETKRHTLVFNGEIYNYVELREELRSCGHHFTTQSDTEVLLKGFMEWGEACLEKLNGMFAIAWWDANREQLLLARDRFGEKPLFYVPTDGGIIFASEIKALFPLLRVPPQPNLDAIYTYLEFGETDIAPHTFFSGVYSLPQASKLISNKVGFHESQYWELQESNQKIDNPGERYRELFLDSLRLRSRSDVPVGTCLSGGLDSSSIVCGLSHLEDEGRIKPMSRKAFSACYSQYDESPQIRATVAHSRSESFLETPQPNDLQSLGDLIAFHDEPFHSFAAYASYAVMKMARQNNVTVVLNGQGADESLAGYKSYVVPYLVDVFWGHGGSATRKAAADAYELTGKTSSQLLFQSIRFAAMNWAAPQAKAFGLKGGQAASNCFGMWQEDVVKNARRFTHTAPTHISSALKKSLYTSLFTANLPLYLRVEDRNSMANSMESRLPFLDHRLVEFAFSLPPWELIAAGRNKRLLREGMAKLLPQQVTDRKNKFGFPIPQAEWLFVTLKSQIQSLLQEPSQELKSLLKTDGLVELFLQHSQEGKLRSDTSAVSRFWFRVVSLELWFRRLEDLRGYCGKLDSSVTCASLA